MVTKTVQMAGELNATTFVDTAGNLIAVNLHTTSENADLNAVMHHDNETEFNGFIHSCNSEGLIQKIEK